MLTSTNSVAVAPLEPDVQPGTVRLIQYLVFLLPVVPSPALASGPQRFLAPAVMLGIALAFTKVVPQGRHFPGKPMFLITGAALVTTTYLEGGGDRIERSISRAIITIFVIVVASRASRFGLRRILMPYFYGTLLLSAIIIATSIAGRSPLGAEILPTRSFVLPVSLPKTSGVLRSFGEIAMILAGGIVIARFVERRAWRVASLALLLSGAAIAQSRNVIVTLVVLAVISTRTARRQIRRTGWWIIVILALTSPAVTGYALRNFAAGQFLVGEGIYERNVSARTDIVQQLLDFWKGGDWILDIGGGARARWLDEFGAAPHNHFVSLIAFDGIVGPITICVFFLIPAWVLAKQRRPLENPLATWLVATIVALSFYEGAFSPIVALVIALALADVSPRDAWGDVDPASQGPAVPGPTDQAGRRGTRRSRSSR